MRAQNAVILEGRSDISSGRVVVLHGGDTGFQGVTDIPQARAFVHVLVKPFLSKWQMKLLNKKGKLGMERLERGKNMLKELNRHEVM